MRRKGVLGRRLFGYMLGLLGAMEYGSKAIESAARQATAECVLRGVDKKYDGRNGYSLTTK